MDSDREDNGPSVTGSAFHDVSSLWRGLLSLKAFWYDMRCRQHAWAHKATLVLGLLEILGAVGFCIALHLKHAPMTSEGEVCMNQLTMVLGIAGLSQGFLTANGICMENAAMLLIANLNGFYILGYLAMHLNHEMITHTVDIIVVCVFSGFTALHLVFSIVAWGGEFHRFVFFRVGGDSTTVKRYRFYELLLASLLLDLVVTVTTCGNLFFMIQGLWWEYLILALIVISACLGQAAVRTAVRYEKTCLALVSLFTQTLVTCVCAVALWYKDFMGVTFSSICDEAPIVMFGLMAGTHVLCIIVFICCASFFGDGMKIVFSNELAAIDFVNDNYERHKLLAQTLLI